MAVDVVTNVKIKTIDDFNKLLKRLAKGYRDDYSMILHQIAFIQVCPNLDKIDSIYEYLINN